MDLSDATVLAAACQPIIWGAARTLQTPMWADRAAVALTGLIAGAVTLDPAMAPIAGATAMGSHWLLDAATMRIVRRRWWSVAGGWWSWQQERYDDH